MAREPIFSGGAPAAAASAAAAEEAAARAAGAYTGGQAAQDAFEATPQWNSSLIPPTSSTPSGIPASPTPIAGGSFTATGASLGTMAAPGIGTGIGAGAGLLMDGALLWWQKQEADKAAAKQLREARRINAAAESRARLDRLEERRRFELDWGIAQEDRRMQMKDSLKQERIAKLQRVRQGMLDKLAMKGKLQDQFVQRGYI